MATSKGRACQGKHRNDTREAALAQLRSLVRNRGALPAAYRPYQCRHCGGWHIGHRPQRSR